MPTAGLRKRRRNDRAIPLSERSPPVERRTLLRRTKRPPPRQHGTVPQRRKSRENNSESLRYETDDDIPMAKRRKRRSSRKTSGNSQTERPTQCRSISNSSYSSRGNLGLNSSKLRQFRQCHNQSTNDIHEEGSQVIAQHQREPSQRMPETNAPNIGRDKDETEYLVFPFNKPENELIHEELHTVELFPVPLLWNRVKSQPGPRFSKLSELIIFLGSDTECSFYVGQDLGKSTKEIFHELVSENSMILIEECLQKTGVDQRVPILNPREFRVEPPGAWPLITDYHRYILQEHREVLDLINAEKHYRLSGRRRMFSAGETSTLGLGPTNRIRKMLVTWRKEVPVRARRGRKRGFSDSNYEGFLREERARGKLKPRSRRRSEPQGNTPKTNLQMQEPNSEVPMRPKRKRRPNVMYSDAAFDKLIFDPSDSEDGGNRASSKKSTRPMESDPPYLTSRQEPGGLDESLAQDFLGTESSENEVEIPVHLVTISNFIDYVPDEQMQSSSVCSSQAENESNENHVEEPSCIVDRLGESEDGDSRDPLFDGIEDNILRMMDEEVSGELLTKHVFEDQPFDEDEHIEHSSQQEARPAGQDCSIKPQNVKLRLNEHERTCQYGTPGRTGEREEHYFASERKDGDTIRGPSDSNAGSSSSVKPLLSGSSRQGPYIETDCVNAQKSLISDGNAERNSLPGEQVESRARGMSDVQHSGSERMSLKSVSYLEKRAAPSDAEGEGCLTHARVSPSAEDQSFQGAPVSTMDMVRCDNDSTQEDAHLGTKVRKSARVQNLQKNVGFQSEVHSKSLAVGTNDYDSAICDSTYAYLWDHQACSRQEKLIPLREAISICLKSDKFSVYDGQDYDFRDVSRSALTAITEKDMVSWGNREAQPGKIRKVRVWNLETGGLRTHYRSPAVQRLAGWIDSNPENVVFSPSMILPSVSIASVKNVKSMIRSIGERDSQALKARFRDQVEHHVIHRIRDLRIRDIPKKDLNCVQLWNTIRKRIEPLRRFASRQKLTRFLFSNPWLEPLSGQDQLFQLESLTLNKLIHVRLSIPASVATYWDCVDQKVYNLDTGTEEFGTIGEFLASSTRYLLYQGQDMPYFQCLVKYHAALRCPGFPVLVKCGTEMQRLFFAKRWVTVVVDPSSCSTACAVFWKKESKTVHMQPEICGRISISSYTKEHPEMELYAGQDQSDSVQQEVRLWMELMQKASPQVSRSVVLLTRCEFAPLKYNAVAWPDLIKECGSKPIQSRKVSEHSSSVVRNEDRSPQPLGDDIVINSPVEENLCTTRAERRKSGVPALEVDDENRVGECFESKRLAPSNDNGFESNNCKYTTRSGDEVIVLEPSICTSIGSDDMFSEDGAMCPELEEASQNFEERLRAPARTAARLLTIIKEVGPRVLKQELVHDLRHTLYENTTMEVGSVSQLSCLMQQCNDLHFVRMAAEICSTLESLDISGCFTGSADVGYGGSDLLSVREELESGKICTMTDVIKRFRVVCQNLIQLNEGFYLEFQAMDLKNQGEIVIQGYMEEKKEAFEREVKIRRLAKICDRARQIGFRKQRNRSTANAPMASGNIGHDLTIRSPSAQARVTFLNYRDEKGNSVMGKRTSVRVFGLPIDRKTCQREAGCARPCHICGREVFEADQNSLTCGNRFFGSCNECVCKPCLESVTCMESQEFLSFRDGQEWICVHCRGLCPAGSECLRNEYERSRHSNRLESVRFTWPHEFAEPPLSVLVSLLRRERNGEFGEDFERGVKVSLSQTSNGVWSAMTECRIGAYRALIKADGKWIAGTTFCVFSLDAVTTANIRKKNKLNVRRTYYGCENRPSMSVRRRGPSVHWSIAENDRSGPVHAIREKDSEDANQMIEDCSRVNGYDWQRAKRHNVVHWRPVVQQEDPPEVERGKSKSIRSQYKSHCFTSKTQKVTLTHSVKDHSSWTRNGTASPEPRPGLSYEQLCTEWNTFKYDEMLKSLWGIVTGRSGIHGIGLFTITGYRKGDFIIEYAGDLIRTPLADIREARYEAAGLGTYLFKINEQEIVDATVQSNRARFTNHSCDPNMIARIIHVRGRDLVALQATRDIPRFAELTFDYKLPIEDTKVQCLCNAWNCVGVMN